MVQVTVAPAGTVSLAGTNAKLLMLTASPAVGGADVAGPVVDALAPPGGAAVDPAVPPPVIPGVVLACGPKLIDGCASGAGPDPEQPQTSSRAAVDTATAGSAASER